MSKWQAERAERNRRSLARLNRALPRIFPPAVLSWALGRPFLHDLFGCQGKLSARYWSEAVKERKEPSGIFYYWNGERPRDPNAPQLEGMGEILLESADRAAGYFKNVQKNLKSADGRCSLARRSRGHSHPGRKRRSRTRGVDRRAAEALEVDRERLAVDPDQTSVSLRPKRRGHARRARVGRPPCRKGTRINVRYGSLADIGERPRMSALPPKADIHQRHWHVR